MRICFARVLAVVVVASAAFGTMSCKTAALAPGMNSLALAPGQSNQKRLLATAVLPSFADMLATADNLNQQGALPLNGEQIENFLLRSLSASNSPVWDQIDKSQPMALAAVKRAEDPANKQPFVAVAFKLVEEANVMAAVAAIGQLGKKQKDAYQLEMGNGESVWAVRQDAFVTVGRTFEDLSEAGLHALTVASRRPPNGAWAADLHLLIRAFVPALRGTSDVATWKQETAADLMKEVDEGYALRDTRAVVAERAVAQVFVDFIVDRMSQTQVAEFNLTANPATGVSIALNGVPLPGSDFEKQIAKPAPFSATALDLADPAAIATSAMGPNPKMLELTQAFVDAQAKEGVAGAAVFAEHQRKILSFIDGSSNLKLKAQGDRFACDYVLGLHDPGGQAVLGPLETMFRDPETANYVGNIYGLSKPKIEVERQADRLRVSLAFGGDDGPATPAAFARSFFGHDELTFVAAVQGRHLIFASDPGAAERISALAAGATTSTANGDPARALAAAKGLAMFSYIDPWSLARPIAYSVLPKTQAMMAAGVLSMPGLAELALPLSIHLQDGGRLEFSLHVPVKTMVNASKLGTLLPAAAMGIGSGMSAPSGR